MTHRDDAQISIFGTITPNPPNLLVNNSTNSTPNYQERILQPLLALDIVDRLFVLVVLG